MPLTTPPNLRPPSTGTPTTPLFANPQWDAHLQLLTLEVTVLSGHPTTALLGGWGRGIGMTLVVDGEPETHDNPFADPLFPIEFFGEPLLQGWVGTIPIGVLERLQCFAMNPMGFLQIVSRDVAALELFMCHPTLFALLHQEARKRRQGLPWFLLHCRMKRRRILQVCGLPPTPSAVRLLHKLRFGRFNHRHIDMIAKVLVLDCSRLSHLPTVSEALLDCAVRQPLLLQSRLLLDWQDGCAAQLMNTLDDIGRMRRHRFISPRRWLEPLRHCRNLADVLRLHGRMVEATNRKKPDNRLEQAIFPKPPLAGTATIVPLATYADLRLEGQAQQHCILSYAESILSGDYYVYRVLAPERATLGLGILRHGKMAMDIVLEQLKGRHNTEVGDATWEAVETWLLGHHHLGGRHD
jgi:hypothetical protein